MMLLAALALPTFWVLVALGFAGLALLWVLDRRAEARHENRCAQIVSTPLPDPVSPDTVPIRMVRHHARGGRS